MTSFTILFCPQHGKCSLRKYSSELRLSEYLQISPSHLVMYDIHPRDTTPNQTLTSFGGIVANLPGDAIILKSDTETGEEVDIEPNILELLPKMIQDDMKQRAAFLDHVRGIDGHVIG